MGENGHLNLLDDNFTIKESLKCFKSLFVLAHDNYLDRLDKYQVLGL